MTIIVILILIYVVYNFMYCSDNKYNSTNSEAIIPKRKITNLEEELRKQYENNSNNNNADNSNNNGNDNGNDNDNSNDNSNDNINGSGNENNKDSNNDNKKTGESNLDYNDLNDKIIKEQNGIAIGVIDKSIDSGKESLPENIQGVKMVQENKKSNFMMDKNMPYIDLENDMINLSLLPELRS